MTIDDDLDGGPSDTDELPSPRDSEAPALEGRFPLPPKLPSETLPSSERTTQPPSADESVFHDPEADGAEHPMQHAPEWARGLERRTSERFDIQGERMDGVEAAIRALGEAVDRLNHPELGIAAIVQGNVRALYQEMVNRLLEPIGVHEKLLGIHDDRLKLHDGQLIEHKDRIQAIEKLDIERRLAALEHVVLGEGK